MLGKTTSFEANQICCPCLSPDLIRGPAWEDIPLRKKIFPTNTGLSEFIGWKVLEHTVRHLGRSSGERVVNREENWANWRE